MPKYPKHPKHHRFGTKVWVYPRGWGRKGRRGRIMSHDPRTGKVTVLTGLTIRRMSACNLQAR